MNNIPHIVDSGASVIPTKTLTDEELSFLIKETHKSMGVNNCTTFDFIKAFLRKVQEK
jgi:hypothetical protein